MSWGILKENLTKISSTFPIALTFKSLLEIIQLNQEWPQLSSNWLKGFDFSKHSYCLVCFIYFVLVLWDKVSVAPAVLELTAV